VAYNEVGWGGVYYIMTILCFGKFQVIWLSE
jgi:hypothetical protein